MFPGPWDESQKKQQQKYKMDVWQSLKEFKDFGVKGERDFDSKRTAFAVLAGEGNRKAECAVLFYLPAVFARSTENLNVCFLWWEKCHW